MAHLKLDDNVKAAINAAVEAGFKQLSVANAFNETVFAALIKDINTSFSNATMSSIKTGGGTIM